jgi:hypothetical protein
MPSMVRISRTNKKIVEDYINDGCYCFGTNGASMSPKFINLIKLGTSLI